MEPLPRELPEPERLPEPIRRLLAELGAAIGGSVSDSGEVAESIRRIENEGFHLYVVLDARIGVDRDRRRAYEAAKRGVSEGDLPATLLRTRRVVGGSPREIEFRMNIGDARMLRELGIDGTLRVRRPRRAD